jgi:hypothetical protein
MNETQTLSDVSTFSLNVESHRLSELDARIAILNKKAAKFNIPPVTYTKGKEIVNNRFDMGIIVSTHVFTPVTISYQPIRVAGGWRFIAAIEHEFVNDQQHNTVSGYNLSQETEKQYRHVASHCEHCNVDRKRNLTYIIENMQGVTKQVGSTCIADYVGADVRGALFSIQFAAEIESMGDEDDFGGYGSSSGPRMATLRQTVAFSIAHINQYGFVSATKAKEQSEFGNHMSSTATLVLTQLFPSPFMKEHDKLIVSEADYQAADEIIAKWSADLLPKLDNDSDILDSFQYKLALVISLGYVKPKLHALVVGSVAYTFKKTQEEKSPKKSLNEYLPGASVGSKVVLDLTVARMHKFEGNYGTTTILSFTDADGRKVVWFASGSLEEKEWEIGSQVKVKGTVKDLKDDAKFGKQTLMTRIKKVS